MNRTWFVAMSVVFLTTSSTFADTLLVPDDYGTIQEAIDAAFDGDEIVVADGTYTGVGNRDLDFGGRAITLRSESGDRSSCIIDCEGADRFAVFLATDTAIVESLTIRNGNAAIDGGAVWAGASASPSFIDCVFHDNTAGSDGGAIWAQDASITLIDTEVMGSEGNQGGAVLVDGGEVTFTGCTFTANLSRPGWGGGAVRVMGGALVTCTGTIFEGNISGAGGGGMLLNDADSASVISGCQFLDNECPGRGGGFATTGSNGWLIVDCLFEGNTAETGGGATFERGSAESRVQDCIFRANSAIAGAGAAIQWFDGAASQTTLVDCLFVENTATSEFATCGGGLMVWGSSATPSIINCTLAHNQSDDLGGGMCAMEGGQPELIGCVLWGNEAPTGAEIQIGYPDFDSGGAVEVSYSDIAGGEAGVSICCDGALTWGDGNIDADPLYIDPENGDFRLAAGSPCIDAADNDAVPMDVTTDLGGDPRFVDDPNTKDTGNGEAPIVDMGAYEFQVVTCDWDLDGDGNVGTGDLILLLGSWGDPYGTADLIELLGAWGPCR